MTDLLKDGPYGDTSKLGKATVNNLPLPDEQVDLETFQIGNNYKSTSSSQLLPSDIIDITPLFWQGKPNAFWFKTHDDRVFVDLKSAKVVEAETNATLDNVVVGNLQKTKFTNSLQSEGAKLKDFIVNELAPVFLCAKNAVWVAQQELRVLTKDSELELSDIEPSYNTFLRKAMRFKMAEFICEQLSLPESAVIDMLGKEHTVANPELEFKALLTKMVTDMGGVRGKDDRKQRLKA